MADKNDPNGVAWEIQVPAEDPVKEEKPNTTNYEAIEQAKAELKADSDELVSEQRTHREDTTV